MTHEQTIYISEARSLFQSIGHDILAIEDIDAEGAAEIMADRMYDKFGHIEGIDWYDIAYEAVRGYF